MNSSLETFEIGNGFGDIGGDELDLRNLELTDTLIGSCMSELTQALGEPENNVFEQYHLGDGGISDIELTSFDSALIQDAGIRPYSEDPNAAEEEMSELAELMGKRPTPKAKKTEEVPEEKPRGTPLQVFIATQIASKDFDKNVLAEVNDDKFKWIDSDLNFNTKGEIDEGDDDYLNFTDEDFVEGDEEFDILAEEVADGFYDELYAEPVFTLVK